MSARLEDGWIRVPFSGADLSRVEIAVGESRPEVWKPAFLNTVGDERVAQVRPDGLTNTSRLKVWIRVDGVPVLYGALGDPSTQSTRRRRR